jgi:2-oxoisovalerate dehydrogenase E2 component (dihydrolipoyl transacylase)
VVVLQQLAVFFSRISFLCVIENDLRKKGEMRPCIALAARHSFRLVRGTAYLHSSNLPFLCRTRSFSTATPWQAIRSHKLTDIGEGTKEVMLNQWFVEEGARVTEWDTKICEVQSDKATVEITAMYSGVIKKLYFKADDQVQVGDTLLDVEVEGEDEAAPAKEEEATSTDAEQEVAQAEQTAEDGASQIPDEAETEGAQEERKEPGNNASLATPAVRGLLKEHNLKIEDIEGTGRDGRVLKEDVYKHLEGPPSPGSQKPALDSKQTETPQRLTPIQAQMFKSMTGSLTIPHFLYSDTANITSLSAIRKALNAKRNPDTTPKLSYLPFIVKSVSLALNKYPILNARVDTTSGKPQLIMRANHNIGIAMDTPSGLLVPVIKSVNIRSIVSIASEIARLGQLGQAGKLSNADLSGGTITVSNIGNIGGETVGPVIVEGQLAILGVGKVKAVPVFAEDGKTLQKAEVVGLSWSADHRVVDGATMARMASIVQGYLEEPGAMIVDMS